MSEYTPISDLEKGIIAVVCRASFPPGTGAKRFIGRLASGEIRQLRDSGRAWLAFIAYRFRRQYSLTLEQWQWVNEWQPKFKTASLESSAARERAKAHA